MTNVVAIQDADYNIHIAVVYGELFTKQVEIGDTVEASSTHTVEVIGRLVGYVDLNGWYCPLNLEDVTLEVKWW